MWGMFIKTWRQHLEHVHDSRFKIMEQELFSTAAVNILLRRFPSLDKISVFESSDFKTDMSAMILNATCEYGSRAESKLFSATVNDKPCLIRYIDITPNVETQADTLVTPHNIVPCQLWELSMRINVQVYLSLLKTLRHSHLEDASVIGLLEQGTGRSKETKVSIQTLPKEICHIYCRTVGCCYFRARLWMYPISAARPKAVDARGLEDARESCVRRCEGARAAASECNRPRVIFL